MTIQQLFKKADTETVFHAYTLIRPVFDEFDNHTMQEKARVLKEFRKHIEEVCNQFANCEPEIDKRAKTLFVIGRTHIKWGESYLQDIECFTTYDDEAASDVKTNFTMWNDDGEGRLNYYGIDFDAISVIAGYSIAAPSVIEQGIDVCCAAILQELFTWGLTSEQRKDSFDDLSEKLKEAEIDVENGRTISAEELLDHFDEEFMKDATDDEKEHHRLRREYEKSVREIEHRYSEGILTKDHQRFIDIVRSEYGDRKTRVFLRCPFKEVDMVILGVNYSDKEAYCSLCETNHLMPNNDSGHKEKWHRNRNMFMLSKYTKEMEEWECQK